MTWSSSTWFISTIVIRFTRHHRLGTVLATVAAAIISHHTQLQTLSAGCRTDTVLVSLLSLDTLRSPYCESPNRTAIVLYLCIRHLVLLYNSSNCNCGNHPGYVFATVLKLLKALVHKYQLDHTLRLNKETSNSF